MLLRVMMTTIHAEPQPTQPRPWDLVGIIRHEGRDGVRRRYITLAPFAELLRRFGDLSWAPPEDWYVRPKLVLTLAALQAQWDECNSPVGRPWVASRFWTQEVQCLREARATAGPGVELAEAKHPHSLYEYLDSPAFEQVLTTLSDLAIAQAVADDVNAPAKGKAR